MGRTRVDDESVTRLRIALSRIVRALDRRTNIDDVTRTQMIVLGTIHRNTRIPLADLAEFEGINPTMVSRIVSKLEDRGLVRRVPDPQDRRVGHVEITEAGSAEAVRHRAERAQVFADLLVEVDEDVADRLVESIDALEALARVAWQRHY